MSERKPSTSGMSANDLRNLPRGAISITGNPIGRNVRLPSIKSPRDLTLGTSLKRTFTPNIPVRREKKSVENSSTNSTSQSAKANSSNARGGRGRGRGKKTYVQTPGAVFGEGVTGQVKNFASRSNDYTPNVTAANIPKPVFKSEIVVKTEKIEDDAELSDQFIDDGDTSDEDKDMLPVAVPLSNLYLNKVEMKDLEGGCKPGMAKIKQENSSPSAKAEIFERQQFQRLALHSDFIGKEDLFLMEFPDYFSAFSSSSSENESNAQPCSAASQWSNVSEGYLGKLQFLRNGKSQLVIGPHKFEVFSKRPSPFLQELISVHTCDNVSQMSLIGHIKHEARFLPNVLDIIGEDSERIIQ